MQPRPSFDRAFLILIAIGVVSILGTGCIVLKSGLGKSRIPPTAIPSSFSSPEAGTLTATQSPSATPTQAETPPTAISTATYPAPPAETLPSTSTLMITESLRAPSATSTQDRIQPLPVGGEYDDTDPNIAYDQYWTVLKTGGTANAYKGTLHASYDIGAEAFFRFKGKRFQLGYQRGKNFGIVTVMIDDQPYRFHEEAFDLLWTSPQLARGDHFVRIIHESGQSINLDYIVIMN